MKKLFTIICITLAVITNAQNTFTAKVLDSENAEALIGASLTSFKSFLSFNPFYNVINL